MNRLAAILPPAQVLVHVEATSKKRAFEEAGLLFEECTVSTAHWWPIAFLPVNVWALQGWAMA